MKIYRCAKCGNIVAKLFDSGAPLSCCGEEMAELKAGVVDASLEKHVPALSLKGDVLTVRVGEVDHPMVPEHYIQVIVAVQEDKVQYVGLAAGQEPGAVFRIDPEKPATVYEYCNLHGLWAAKYSPAPFDEVVCSAEFPQGCMVQE